MKQQTKSILEMARGAFLERADYEITKLVRNILDPNTKAVEKRKLSITMTLMPDDDRKNINVKFESKCTLAPTNPVMTSLYLAGENSDGMPQILEMTPQAPGQFNMFGEMTPEDVAVLKISEIT